MKSLFIYHHDIHVMLCCDSTPIFTGDGEGGSGFAAAAAAAAAGGVSGYDFGVDPNLDPELALALRVSMEEERARQEAAAKKAAEDASKQEKGGEQQAGSQEASSQDATMTDHAGASTSEAENKTTDLMVGVFVEFINVFFMFCSLFDPLIFMNVYSPIWRF
jgi:hypothetical protein